MGDVRQDLREAIQAWSMAALELLCPWRCIACGGDGPAGALRSGVGSGNSGWNGGGNSGWCASCVADLPWHPAGAPRLELAGDGLDGGLDGWVVALRLEGSVRELIHGLKYGGRAEAAVPLVAALAAAVRRRGLDRAADLVVAVPSYWLKSWTRGIDHARLLAGGLAEELARPLLDQALRRVRSTVAQGQARSARDRARQVAGAFAAARRRTLRGRVVALVDDVATSGATARECARVLKDAGASKVLLFAVAGNG